MALMGGLIETHREHVASSDRASIGEWAIRNAWALVLAGSLVFWTAVGAIIVFV